MQNLINELNNPGLDAEGKILPVSTVKRRAAEAIEFLRDQGQADLNARLALQTELADARQYIVEQWGPPIEYCIADYKHVMNEDYLANFT